MLKKALISHLLLFLLICGSSRLVLAQVDENGLLLPPEGLSSPTHTESQRWSANNSPKFTWTIPVGLRSFGVVASPTRLQLFPETGITLKSKSTSYQVPPVADGVWFFHLFAKNSAGWGAPAIYEFWVDATPPEAFSLALEEGTLEDEAAPTVFYSTKDALSGLSHYEVVVDGGQPTRVTDSKYTIPPLRSGGHQVSVTAYDVAGNRTSVELKFVISDPVAPVFDQKDFFRQLLVENKMLVYQGTGRKEAQIFLQVDSLPAVSGQVGDDGRWAVEGPPLTVGDHRAISWVKVGPNKSAISETLDFEVTGFFLRKPGVLPLLFLLILMASLGVVGYILTKKGFWKRFKKTDDEDGGDYLYIEPSS